MGLSDINEIRKEFPLFKNEPEMVYLDSCATSQKPDRVLNAVREFYEKNNANPFRGIYDLSERATEAYEDARRAVAGFINAEDPEEIVFTRNATESLNLAAFSLGELLVGEGDEVVISVSEHHSNMLPWRYMAERKKAKVKYVDCGPDGSVSPEELAKVMSDKTKIVAVTAMSNVLGKMNDLKALAAMAHTHGAVFVADGAQSVPHGITDVRDTDVDLLAFSGHKLLAPMGIGVLYGKRRLLEDMPPFLTGGEMIERVSTEDVIYAGSPHKFEAGTVNAGGAVGLAEAIKWIREIGMENMMKRELALTKLALTGMKKIPGITVVGGENAEDHNGIITFKVENVHPHDVSAILADENIAVRAGHHCAEPLHRFLGIPSTTRASIMFYNTEEEIEKFLKAVSGIRRLMGYSE
ncbi:MAG: cysteine desulfurase [Lachnospiraceae bacterium]|nr:cysteine desulfurase [Lachnospiraceae bacterium]